MKWRPQGDSNPRYRREREFEPLFRSLHYFTKNRISRHGVQALQGSTLRYSRLERP